MPKRAVLRDKLKEAKVAAPVRSPREKQALRNGGRGRLVGVHVSEAAYRQIRLLAVELDMKHNELLRAALNAFLQANDREPLA